ncbi:helicase domino-like [Styela clava]
MQQDDYSADKSGRYVPDAMQGQQFSISNTDANAPVSLSGVQQPQMNLFGTENTTQPPPYRAAHPSPLPSMTPTFSQHIQPQYTENPLQSQFSYRTPQSSYQSQSYNVGVSPGQIQTVFDSQLSNPIALSPGSQMSVPQGMRAVSPSQPAIPRKSIAGMMSPIRAQGQPMPPPTSPAALLASRMQGPMSPLSVYMSTAQSPQRRSQPVVLHAQNMVSGQYLPSSPVYQHPSAYSYSPQQVQTCQFSPQSSPVATSPRYVDPTQHKQMSPLLATHAQLHSPQSTHPGIVQVPRSPFKAARQLSMGVSPNKVQPVNTQWHQHPQSTRTTSQEMWENVSAPVLPSLPVLSADTLDLLSTLTVSTVSAPVQSSTISTVSDTHVQQSPLLQKHLLMPVKPIVPPTNSNLLVVSDSGKTATTSLTGTSSSQPKPYKVEAPPSRSNLKHSDRPTLLIKRSTEENLINSDKNIVSLVTTTCTDSSASTFSSSNIVTSSVHKENIDISPVDLPSTDPVSSIVMENKSNMAASAVGTTVSQSVSVSVMPLSTVPKNVLVDDKHSRNSLTSASASPLPQVPQDILEKRAKLCEIHKAKLKEKLELYKECLTELFFLQNGGNCMDFIQFKKRPSAKLLEYLKKMMPDGPHVRRKSRKISQESTVSNNSEIAPTSPASTLSNASSRKISSDDGKKVKLKLPENGADNVLKSVQLPGNERSISRKRSTSQDKTIVSSPAVVTVTKSVMSTQVHGNQISTSKGQSSPLRLKRLSRQNASTPLDESIGSQEEILERAKQEAVIQRKVVELRKQGLWTQRRLPKVQEPPRNKTHWDYLLEEMRWLAADFAQERKWKRAAARKLVRTVAAYHKEQHDKVRRAEKEEQNRLRRIASTMAREIRTFWGSIGKVVEYKQRSLLDEKRQKALDLHLSYIVDQTEKYSDWLSQGLNKTSAGSSPRSLTSSKPGSDDEFLPQGESSDDEETIAVAEEELEKIDDTEDELSLLKKESELPFNELLSSLPAEVIENIGKPLEESVDEKSDAVEGEDYNKGESSQIKTEEPTESEKEAEGSDGEDSTSSKPTPISLRRSARKRKVDSTNASKKDEADPSKRQRIEHESQGGDEEFSVDQESGEDDEATVEEEEKSGEVDHKKEIEDLQAEGEMPIEELMKLYGAAFDQDPDGEEEKQQSEDEEEVDESEDDKDVQMEKEESETEASDEDIEDDKQDEEEIGMDYLFKADLTKDDNIPMIVPSDTSAQKDDKKPEGESSPSKEITDVAAEAASLQPTGFTLATTQVVTPIPVLLKHTLREYQHIGLDWLVTMYDKRLNGILADEMGLGKTIQTIALLAHLACEKGVWGPHLIVVPTSVMLNWEMEFKKWCPGFKILTYYGSQKERKAKRTGWTKSNAFHVCITSYKLVLQDNVSFRRKKWKYLVLDEAQNIKNFKSQRWQTLLNFNSQRRLLLTGTPLQNNLMELWSLMHFLMPHVFQSHKEFKEWFSNPLTGMIEGSQEYNEKLVRRLHKVLRPFLLRRIKKDVEKQMPNKYEHVVRCHLSKRQRFLYEDFMSRASTKDTLDSGHFMSVINILMQLRKVCNHPNLFEPRSIVSPFTFDRIVFYAPSLATKVFEKSPFETLNLEDYHLHLPSLTNIHQYNAERMRELKTPRKLIEELTTDCVQGESEKPQRSKSQVIREQLSQLLKEREKLKNSTVVLNQQTGSTLPVLTIPISSSGGTTIFPSRVITIPQSNSEDAAGTKTSSTQSITLQYQTPQGTRVTIPNKQIRQLPGGVVQIMTSGSTKSVSGQTVPTQGALRVPANSRGLQNGSSDIEKGQLMEIDEQRKDGDLKQASENEFLELKDPTTYADRLHQILIEERRQRCIKMANVNEKKCEANPDWLPRGTIDYLKDIFKLPYMQSRNTIRLKSDVMDEFIKSNSTVLKEIKPVTDRFVFAISKALAKRIDFHVSHPSPSLRLKEMTGLENLEFYLKKEVQPFHRIHQATKIQFPEARLIQYDCGKLQILDVLLRRFWTEKHKCLIFTQMTKVLDILEAFLSYHGYRYLRLDGSTKVEQRMLLMERFNNDPRIFCFILSTRSGGIGVNLTGADTVIFYDSDWNPTMDAQAQDRCHRIGQTRDVHIYRLISERTVEENILKKANQKRLLGDLAIEGGSFTTAFFKEQAIKDLFNEPSGLEDLPSALVKDEKQTTEKPPLQVLARPITARQKAIAAAKEAEAKAGIDVNEKESSIEKPVSQSQDPNVQASSWEDALQQTEDKEDVDAAKQLKEEQDADMEEFTENAEGEEGEVSRVQEEMKSLYEELTPVEKYALRYLEETTEEMNKEELELAEEQVHRSKQDWEITHLMALKEEEERRLEEEEDEIFYTRDDAENQVYIDDVTGEIMPVWFPPTPPQDDNDIYFDPVSCLLYLPTPMSEDQLPTIHVKKERKRTKPESESPGGAPGPKKKIFRSECHAPRSIFDRPLSQLKKREIKANKDRLLHLKKPSSTANTILPHAKALTVPALPSLPVTSLPDKENITTQKDQTETSTSSTSAAATVTDSTNKNPEWLINEDWKLLQAVEQVLEMPLSLAVLMPAHTPNWDLVADVVNSIASVYRSPKMCKQRFENVIAPREEGISAAEVSMKKKIKGIKTPGKPKMNKPQRTTNVYSTDNNLQHTTLYSSRFDVIKETCGKRTMPMKSAGSGQFQRNPKHTSILMDNGITYDKPLPPIKVATLRADRIAREKQALEVAKQQQQLQSQAIQQHTANMSQISTSQVSKSAGMTTLGVSQLTAIPLSGGASNIIVNSSTLSALTKKMNQQSAMSQFSAASAKTAKTTLINTALHQTLLRTAAGNEPTQNLQQQQQIQIQQQNQVGTMVTVGLLHRLSNQSTVTSVASCASGNTITLSSLTRPSISVPGGAVIQQGSQLTKQLTKQQKQRLQRLQEQMERLQHHKQQQQKKQNVKTQITPQKFQLTPEAMKKFRQQQQQLESGNVITVAGKQRKTTPITQKELELLMKNPGMRRQMQQQKQQTAQVQIAPVHAQVQAQQVQEAAAQQAAQHIVTSKPLPITVPVSSLVSVAAVNLGGMNMSIASTSTSGQAKPLIVTGQQVPVNIQQQITLQRQYMKQNLLTQQQSQSQQQAVRQGQVLASKVGVKQTVYAMVPAPPLVTQKQRRVNVAVSSAGATMIGQQQGGTQQPVQLTVTKLLQSQAMPGQSTSQVKQQLVKQGADGSRFEVQQIRQSQLVSQQQQIATATIVPSSHVGQPQRLISSQRNLRQIQQLASNQQQTQMILTPASSVVSNSQQFIQRQNPNVVASISIAAPSSSQSASQQQMTLASPTVQSASLSQQLQSLLTPQVLRAQSSQAVVSVHQSMRVSQPQHLVLSQVTPQQQLSVSPQTPGMTITSPTTPTTMTLAPSLVQLPASAVTSVSVSQSMLNVPTTTQQQPETSASVQYITRSAPQQ